MPSEAQAVRALSCLAPAKNSEGWGGLVEAAERLLEAPLESQCLGSTRHPTPRSPHTAQLRNLHNSCVPAPGRRAAARGAPELPRRLSAASARPHATRGSALERAPSFQPGLRGLQGLLQGLGSV